MLTEQHVGEGGASWDISPQIVFVQLIQVYFLPNSLYIMPRILGLIFIEAKAQRQKLFDFGFFFKNVIFVSTCPTAG